MASIQVEKVNGRKVIGTGALTYCNTKYHKPYLARLDEQGGMDWQDKEYVGYGKHRQTYYVVEDLQVGDYIQAAGGSGGNKYPFKGQVTEVGEDYLEVTELSDKAWGNVLAERKNGDGADAKLEEARRLAAQLVEMVGRDKAAELVGEVS